MMNLKATEMKQTIIISLIVGLLAFFGGYFLNQAKLISAQNFNKRAGNKQIQTNTSQGNNVKINSLSGAVKAINGNTLTLKINQSDERTVETDSQTKIYILEEKSQEQYRKEMAEYNKKIQEQTNNQTKLPEATMAPLVSNLSPEVFAKKTGLFSDIKNGITITAVAAGQDIKDAKQFKATEIFIPPAPNTANNAIIQPLK